MLIAAKIVSVLAASISPALAPVPVAAQSSVQPSIQSHHFPANICPGGLGGAQNYVGDAEHSDLHCYADYRTDPRYHDDIRRSEKPAYTDFSWLHGRESLYLLEDRGRVLTRDEQFMGDAGLLPVNSAGVWKLIKWIRDDVKKGVPGVQDVPYSDIFDVEPVKGHEPGRRLIESYYDHAPENVHKAIMESIRNYNNALLSDRFGLKGQGSGKLHKELRIAVALISKIWIKHFAPINATGLNTWRDHAYYLARWLIQREFVTSIEKKYGYNAEELLNSYSIVRGKFDRSIPVVSFPAKSIAIFGQNSQSRGILYHEGPSGYPRDDASAMQRDYTKKWTRVTVSNVDLSLPQRDDAYLALSSAASSIINFYEPERLERSLKNNSNLLRSDLDNMRFGVAALTGNYFSYSPTWLDSNSSLVLKRALGDFSWLRLVLSRLSSGDGRSFIEHLKSFEEGISKSLRYEPLGAVWDVRTKAIDLLQKNGISQSPALYVGIDGKKYPGLYYQLAYLVNDAAVNFYRYMDRLLAETGHIGALLKLAGKDILKEGILSKIAEKESKYMDAPFSSAVSSALNSAYWYQYPNAEQRAVAVGLLLLGSLVFITNILYIGDLEKYIAEVKAWWLKNTNTSPPYPVPYGYSSWVHSNIKLKYKPVNYNGINKNYTFGPFTRGSGRRIRPAKKNTVKKSETAVNSGRVYHWSHFDIYVNFDGISKFRDAVKSYSPVAASLCDVTSALIERLGEPLKHAIANLPRNALAWSVEKHDARLVRHQGYHLMEHFHNKFGSNGLDLLLAGSGLVYDPKLGYNTTALAAVSGAPIAMHPWDEMARNTTVDTVSAFLVAASTVGLTAAAMTSWIPFVSLGVAIAAAIVKLVLHIVLKREVIDEHYVYEGKVSELTYRWYGAKKHQEKVGGYIVTNRSYQTTFNPEIDLIRPVQLVYSDNSIANRSYLPLYSSVEGLYAFGSTALGDDYNNFLKAVFTQVNGTAF